MPFWTLRRKFAVGALALVVLAFGWAAMVVAVALVATRDQARTADAIVVLGAAQYQRGLAPVVLVTGGIGMGDTLSESDVGRRYLVKEGLPETAVTALPAGSSTFSSLGGVALWFKGRDSRRVLLVSDGFHMLRLQILATRLGLVPFTSPAPNSPIRSSPRRNASYLFAEGFKVPVTWLFNR